jgi:AMMECR1 domain-containing protein
MVIVIFIIAGSDLLLILVEAISMLLFSLIWIVRCKKYTLIEKIAVTEKAIYIYFSSVQAYILPVTAFAEEKSKLEFLEFINSKVNILRDAK